MNRRAAAVVLVLALTCATALAGTLAGITMPETVSVDGKNLVLNGMGLRTKFFVKVYVGALYVEKKGTDGAAIAAADEPKRMVLHFLHEVEKEKLTKSWDEGFAKNAKKKADGSVYVTGKLNSMMEDMAPGDELVVTYVPGKGTEIQVKGKVKGTIEDKGWAEALFLVWLGPEPPTADLKKGILGG